MEINRCSENRAETSEGKTIILHAKFDDFGMRVPDKKLGLAFSVDVRRYKF